MLRFLVIAVLVGVINASLAPLIKHEDRIPDEYIVVLKYDGNLNDVLNTTGNDARIHIQRRFRTVLKGFQARIADVVALREVREREDVAFVEEDGIIRSLETAASWGQDRVDQRFLPLDDQANFAGTGAGVNAYIIDTGIFPDNIYFEERASVFYDAFGGDGIDCDGHGTHCAGTVGSYRYGIAREANLYGVRVLDCFGYGSYSSVIDGVEHVAINHVYPAVASMSLGGGASISVDNAVQSLVDCGVTVVAAAGNDDNNACYYSPARVTEVIAVGATDESDERASFSNYGSCVNIFAPGVDILSTWYGSETATRTLSGTSMACPHVTGAACILLGIDPELTPIDVAKKIYELATSDVISDVRGSPNKLLYIGTDIASSNRGFWADLVRDVLFD